MTWESLKDVLNRLENGAPPPPWAGLFGASPRPEDCSLVLIPVPWDATCSYGAGAAGGPETILTASHQLDLEDQAFERPYAAGITMLTPEEELVTLAKATRATVLAMHDAPDEPRDADYAAVNAASARVNAVVGATARAHLAANRLVGVVGGDHSAPFALLQALGERHPDGFGILHFDAHHDLRIAYEGFTHSHASIMYNVLTQVPAVTKLVQVGIRDFSRGEAAYARAHPSRIEVHYGAALFNRQAKGETWARVTDELIQALPPKVYVSFDIDGLEPAFCPATGTPVPGGLSFDQAVFVIEALARSGRRLIGFDLCEVAPSKDGGDWDGNVGARILYKLCGATLFSNGACGAAMA